MSNIGRRSFVKKSVAGVILAATPLAMTSLINAQGTGGTGGTKDTTEPPYETTIVDTTIVDTTIVYDSTDTTMPETTAGETTEVWY